MREDCMYLLDLTEEIVNDEHLQLGEGHLSYYDWKDSKDIYLYGIKKVTIRLIKEISHNRKMYLCWGVDEKFTAVVYEGRLVVAPINYNDYWAKLNE